MLNPGLPFDISILEAPVPSAESPGKRIARLQNPPVSKELILQLVSLLDLTSLNATDTPAQIDLLVKRALQPLEGENVSVGGICIYQPFIPQARQALQTSDIGLATVSGGFPAGQMELALKCEDIRYSVALGATEIDAVIRRTWPLTGNWQALYDEVKAFRTAAGNVKLKVIIASGELKQPEIIYKTSLTCLMAGADFVKTSTGMEQVNATLDAGYMIMQAIARYKQLSGFSGGFKPAGGIRTTDQALAWQQLIREELGEEWLHPELFRIGASKLLDELIESLQAIQHR